MQVPVPDMALVKVPWVTHLPLPMLSTKWNTLALILRRAGKNTPFGGHLSKDMHYNTRLFSIPSVI